MDPLPAVALEVSSVFPPEQKEAVPVMFAVGRAFTVTTVAADAALWHPAALVTRTV